MCMYACLPKQCVLQYVLQCMMQNVVGDTKNVYVCMSTETVCVAVCVAVRDAECGGRHKECVCMHVYRNWAARANSTHLLHFAVNIIEWKAPAHCICMYIYINIYIYIYICTYV